MRKLKEIWLGLDIINRIILISGILACIWFVVKGRGLYGAALLSAIPHTIAYMVSNLLFLALFAKPFGEKLGRIRLKYDI